MSARGRSSKHWRRRAHRAACLIARCSAKQNSIVSTRSSCRGAGHPSSGRPSPNRALPLSRPMWREAGVASASAPGRTCCRARRSTMTRPIPTHSGYSTARRGGRSRGWPVFRSRARHVSRSRARGGDAAWPLSPTSPSTTAADHASWPGATSKSSPDTTKGVPRRSAERSARARSSSSGRIRNVPRPSEGAMTHPRRPAQARYFGPCSRSGK